MESRAVTIDLGRLISLTGAMRLNSRGSVFERLRSAVRQFSPSVRGATAEPHNQVTLTETVESFIGLMQRVTNLGPVRVGDCQVTVRPSFDRYVDTVITLESEQGGRSRAVIVELTYQVFGGKTGVRVVYREASLGDTLATYSTDYHWNSSRAALELNSHFSSTQLSEENFKERIAFLRSIVESALQQRMGTIDTNPFQLSLQSLFDGIECEESETTLPALQHLEDRLGMLQHLGRSFGDWEIVHSQFSAKPLAAGLNVSRTGVLSHSIVFCPTHSFLFRNGSSRKNFIVNFRGSECSILASGVTLVRARKTQESGYVLSQGLSSKVSKDILTKILMIFPA
ncbi:MAG: hypothetical protein KDD60_04880 [Bdellovibrionales bacterium]|nr:hypothetical protein [Bdellovibrionales bacterium]